MKWNVGILAVILWCSCQNSENINSIIKKTPHEVFVKRNNTKRENFIFLDFWNQMSLYEFNTIKDSLNKASILVSNDTTSNFIINFVDSTFRDIGLSSSLENKEFVFTLNPTFQNDSLIAINLDFNYIKNNIVSEGGSIMSGYENQVINLFKKKYGQPTIQEQKGFNDLKYIWKKDNKVIEIILNSTLEFDVVTKKNYDCLKHFSIFYQNLDLFNKRNSENENDNNKKSKNAKEKAKKSLDNI